MGTKLFVGNLPFSLTVPELERMFARVGPLASVRLVRDRDTGRPRGFGFVEFAENSLADRAVSELNGVNIRGRALVVSQVAGASPHSRMRHRSMADAPVE